MNTTTFLYKLTYLIITKLKRKTNNLKDRKRQTGGKPGDINYFTIETIDAVGVNQRAHGDEAKLKINSIGHVRK